ncbi:MAG: hypothetical protein AAF196_06155 [Planctomycetota bacterium]
MRDLLGLARAIHGALKPVRPTRPAAWLQESARESYVSDHAMVVEAKAEYDRDCLNGEAAARYFDAVDSLKACDAIERHGMPESWEELDDGSDSSPCSFWVRADAEDQGEAAIVTATPTPNRKQRGESKRAQAGQGLLFADVDA